MESEIDFKCNHILKVSLIEQRLNLIKNDTSISNVIFYNYYILIKNELKKWTSQY